MIRLSFLTTELLFAAIWIIARAAVCIVRRTVDWKQEALQLLMYINLAVMIRFIYFPREYLLDLRIGLQPWNLRYNLIPFVNMCDYARVYDAFRNIAGNVAMFVPTGIILPLAYKDIDTFRKTVLAGFLLSLAIELSQLLTRRVTDVDDLILNTAGAAAGYIIYALVRRIISKKTIRRDL